MRLVILLCVSSLTFIGCGGSSSSDNSKSDAGLGGSGAVGGSGGGAAAGGSGAVSGSGGTGATGGSGGDGGFTGECVTDDDCELLSDCCACLSVPKDKQVKLPPCLGAPCFADMCTANGIKKARCSAGQCVKGFDCSSPVLCNALPPTCVAGKVPSVAGGCWGPCVPATECASVPNCESCPKTTACVVKSSLSSTYHCVNVKKGCALDCTCLGKMACVGDHDICSDAAKNGAAVTCACPNC